MTIRELKELLEAYDITVWIKTGSLEKGELKLLENASEEDLDESIHNIDVWTKEFFESRESQSDGSLSSRQCGETVKSPSRSIIPTDETRTATGRNGELR